jgi:hypothetical protein
MTLNQQSKWNSNNNLIHLYTQCITAVPKNTCLECRSIYVPSNNLQYWIIQHLSTPVQVRILLYCLVNETSWVSVTFDTMPVASNISYFLNIATELYIMHYVSQTVPSLYNRNGNLCFFI